MDNLVGIITILSTIALPIGFGMYIGLRGAKQKHTEDMELIKQGIAPADRPKSTPNSLRSLRNGMLCVGVALGLLSSFLITGDMRLTENMTITGACILFFLGLAYIIFYFVSKNKLENQDKE